MFSRIQAARTVVGSSTRLDHAQAPHPHRREQFFGRNSPLRRVCADRNLAPNLQVQRGRSGKGSRALHRGEACCFMVEIEEFEAHSIVRILTLAHDAQNHEISLLGVMPAWLRTRMKEIPGHHRHPTNQDRLGFEKTEFMEASNHLDMAGVAHRLVVVSLESPRPRLASRRSAATRGEGLAAPEGRWEFEGLHLLQSGDPHEPPIAKRFRLSGVLIGQASDMEQELVTQWQSWVDWQTTTTDMDVLRATQPGDGQRAEDVAQARREAAVGDDRDAARPRDRVQAEDLPHDAGVSSEVTKVGPHLHRSRGRLRVQGVGERRKDPLHPPKGLGEGGTVGGIDAFAQDARPGDQGPNPRRRPDCHPLVPIEKSHRGPFAEAQEVERCGRALHPGAQDCVVVAHVSFWLRRGFVRLARRR